MLIHLPTNAQATPRRGIVLLVVIAMLTIFAVIGVAFVYYADAERTSSKYYREAQAAPQPDVDPEIAFGYFLQQLIFPVSDGGPNADPSGVFSVLRGHELLRNMFGWNYKLNPNGTIMDPALSKVFNNQPYDGTGRWHTGFDGTYFGFQSPFNGAIMGAPFSSFSGIDDYFLINYQYYPTDGFVRDPERLGPGTTSGNYPYKPRSSPAVPLGPYVGGFNPSWTYPDMSNIFLAAIKADGTLLESSFDRSRWMPMPPSTSSAISYFNDMSPGNWMWYQNWNPNDSKKTPQPWLKYQVLRPRPADQLLPGEQYVNNAGNWVLVPALGKPPRNPFPPPLSPTGDVQNAKGWTQGPDSFWMYLGSPVLTLPDGRQYTMLYAPLIVDLDGRVNVNVHGNVRGYNPSNPAQAAHLSNSGWGSWEVNLRQVLSLDNPMVLVNGKLVPAPGNQEWVNLFRGVSAVPGTPPALGIPLHSIGRYGPDFQPNGTGSTGNLIPYYSMIDFDGCYNYGMPAGPTSTQPLTLPVLAPVPSGGPSLFNCFPTMKIGNAYFPLGYENGEANEQKNHPAVYNPVMPQPPLPPPNPGLPPPPYDRKFDVSNMERLLRYGDTNTEGLTSELWQLLPQNLGNQRVRNMGTVLSADPDKPGVQPSLWLATANSTLTPLPFTPTYTSNTFLPSLVGGGGPQQFPGVDKRASPLPPFTDFASDWRNANASLVGRLDLNNPLKKPPPGAPIKDFPLKDYPRPDPVNGLIPLASIPVFNAAQAERQAFALEIFKRLIKVTGAYDPMSYNPKATPTTSGQTPNLPNGNDITTLRWLAQYAVNMVDYIDNDDYITPFNWITAYNATAPQGNPQYVADMQKKIAAGQYQPNLATVVDEYVYGNELPRVLINEVYAEFDNWKPDPGLTGTSPHATQFQVNVWVELYNPIQTDTRKPATGSTAPLPASNQGQVLLNTTDGKNNWYAPYQVLITAGNNTLLPGPTSPPASPNVLGDPDSTLWPGPAGVWQYLNNGVVYNSFPTIPPPPKKPGSPYIKPGAPYALPGPAFSINGNVSNVGKILQSDNITNGFLVVAADNASIANSGTPSNLTSAPPGQPTLSNSPNTPYLQNTKPMNSSNKPQSQMSYQVAAPNAGGPPPNPTVMVRRLLCPALPYQPNPNVTSPPFNPYITVDYMDNVPLSIGASYDGKGKKQGWPTPVGSRSSYGRMQPYDNSQPYVDPTKNPQAAKSNVIFPQVPLTATTGVQHTFFQHNNWTNKPTTTPWHFDWMVHLDRKLISPLELLHVACCRPHQVTHLFKYGTNNSYQNFNHAAYWQLQPSLQLTPSTSSPLYRLFEFLETTPTSLGVTAGNYIPGKININTIWDPEILMALCDPQPSNYFPAKYIYNPSPAAGDPVPIWNSMISSRTPSGIPMTGDQPFKPLGVGNFFPKGNLYADGKGFADTIFRPNPNPVPPGSPVPPVVPLQTAMFEVIRHGVVKNATNGNGAKPIVITSPGHGLTTGASVVILGCGGNTAANNTATNPAWTVAVLTPDKFALYSSDGTPSDGTTAQAYTGGGLWRHIPHPAQRYELYNKIYNQMTTRSNVFAVWATVGFFEVVDSTPGQLPKLGAELGLAEGRNIRHRMFAIVDRSQVKQNPGPPLPGFSFNPHAVQPDPATIAVGAPWPILDPAWILDPTKSIQIVPHFSIID